ncbi:MAG: ATP-NAD kinase family protein [Candidatus Bathyarchaeia archaeon]
MGGRLGVVVNPIAGMGGRVGLKGTDGPEALRKALELGAKPIAPKRAEEFLRELLRLKIDADILVGAGEMGEGEAISCGIRPKAVFGERKGETSAEDTKAISRKMAEEGADLIAFCGGDGTARDVMDAIGRSTPALGIPSGVKVHSAVFAINPIQAARIAARFLMGEIAAVDAEVLDIDEEAYRAGRLGIRLHGYLKVPSEDSLMQRSKSIGPEVEDEEENKKAIAKYVSELMGDGSVYVVGPGTTTKAILDELGLEKTLLGVDVVRDGKLLAKDANEGEILRAIRGSPAKIIVSPIGGQAFVFGRGNQQISPSVIREVGLENIIIVATRRKIASLRPTRLLVDTGDADLDKALRGYARVIIDYGEELVIKVE